MFARVALQTVGVLEHLYLTHGPFGVGTVHIPLLLQPVDLPASAPKMQHALVTHKEKDDQKNQDGQHILAPFADFDDSPKLRK